MYHSFHKNIKQLFSELIIKMFLERQISIRKIYEGSCDTKDRSNFGWKFSFASQEYILEFISKENIFKLAEFFTLI